MSGAAFLRIKKLKGKGIIAVAARHNRRVIQGELGSSGSIDPTRSHLNYTLAGPPSAVDVEQLAKDLMAAAGVVKLRKDAVTGLEIVASLPVGSMIDDRDYFSACAQWAGDYFKCPLLSADVHRDEAAAHCHILLLPLIDGRMIGNKLMGGRPVLLAMQKHFYDSVAARYGLRKAPARLSGSSKQAAAAMVLGRLKETGDSALHSQVWAILRDVIESSPEAFMLAMGLNQEAIKKPGKTMAQIFTSKGKGQKQETERHVNKPSAIAFINRLKKEQPNAIAFENGLKATQPSAMAFAESEVGKGQRLSCVAFAKITPHLTSTKPPKSEAHSPASSDHPVDNLDDSEAALPAIQTVQPDKSVLNANLNAFRPKPAKRVTNASTYLRPDTPESRAASLALVRQHHGTDTAAMLEEVHQEDHDVTRERDTDNAAGHWCTERGEFIQAQKPLPRRAARQSANAWVAGELQARGRMKSNS